MFDLRHWAFLVIEIISKIENYPLFIESDISSMEIGWQNTMPNLFSELIGGDHRLGWLLGLVGRFVIRGLLLIRLDGLLLRLVHRLEGEEDDESRTEKQDGGGSDHAYQGDYDFAGHRTLLWTGDILNFRIGKSGVKRKNPKIPARKSMAAL